MINETIIKIEDLSIGYKDKILTKNINLELKRGQLIAVMGVNGCGKSTFMKTLVGLQPMIQGKILINGIDLLSISRVELSKKVAVVFTESILSKELSVMEMVSYGRYPYTSWFGKLNKNDLEIVQHAMSEVEVEQFSKRKLYSLSDGEFQRVMIARALAQQTDILILDEPTSHLDIPNKNNTMNLLSKLSREYGKTIIFSSHELGYFKNRVDGLILFNAENQVTFYPTTTEFPTKELSNVFGEINFST